MRRKGYAEEYLLWLLLLDVAAVALGLLLAYLFRFESGWLPVTKGWNPGDYLRIWPVAVALWILALGQAGVYRVGAPILDLEIGRRFLTASFWAVVLIIAFNFFMRAAEYSRYMPVIAVPFPTLMLIFERWGFNKLLAVFASRQMNRALIVGSGDTALRLADVFRRQLHHGVQVVGFVTDNVEEVGARPPGFDDLEFVGHIDRVGEAARAAKANQIIIAHPDLSPTVISDLIHQCEMSIVDCRVVPNLIGTIVSRGNFDSVGGVPIFDVFYSPLKGWSRVAKRVFDLVVSLGVALPLLPLGLVFAAIVKLESRGPVFYKQQRMGLDGRRFNIYKFRSMRVDAEDKSGPVWTAPDDDRRTRFGAFMRRWNIDELPQLINVVRGDMSLVGPRPERPHFVKKFRDEIPGYMLRHRVKCGITGWAQVNGLRGAETNLKERIAYDLYYIENWSLWFDVRILIMTLGAWKNAY